MPFAERARHQGFSVLSSDGVPAHLAEMSCISLPSFAADREAQPEATGPCWAAVVRGIRIHAVRQPPEIALELLQWADFVDGMAKLQEREIQR
jgi:hypothetical protein